MNRGDETRILVVDDETPIRKFLRIALSQEGFEVLEAATAREAVVQLSTRNVALVLLDLGLPDEDGISVISKIREWSELPIIVLSARGKEDDKVRALDAGAHDYLTKPFGVRELLARVRVALRNSRNDLSRAPVFESGSLRVDLADRKVHKDGTEVHLTPTEYSLLAFLVRHEDKVVTHRQLLKEVWGAAYQAQSQYLRVFINQLRKKVEADPSRPRLILTEPGIGYRLRSGDGESRR